MLPVLFFGAAFFAGVFFFADAVLLAFCAGRVDREEGVSLAASERVEAAWGRHMQRAFLLFFESFFLIFLFAPVDFFAAGFFFTDAFFFAAGLAFRAASGTSSSAEGAPHTAQHLSTAAAQPHGSAAGLRGGGAALHVHAPSLLSDIGAPTAPELALPLHFEHALLLGPLTRRGARAARPALASGSATQLPCHYCTVPIHGGTPTVLKTSRSLRSEIYQYMCSEM